MQATLFIPKQSLTKNLQRLSILDYFQISWCHLNRETCEQASSCEILLFLMQIVSNDEWLITQDECLQFESYVPEETKEQYGYNCSTFIDAFDRDGNEKLNAFEVVFVFNNNSQRSQQINCSMCFDRVYDYYAS